MPQDLRYQACTPERSSCGMVRSEIRACAARRDPKIERFARLTRKMWALRRYDGVPQPEEGTPGVFSCLGAKEPERPVSSAADGYRTATSARQNAFESGAERCTSLGKHFMVVSESSTPHPNQDGDRYDGKRHVPLPERK
jgi:hypothetical protein